MRTLYLAAWFLLSLAVAAAVITGTFNSVSLVIFSLAALALVYGLALWSAFTNSPDLGHE